MSRAPRPPSRPAGADHGIVTLAALDLRHEPDHRAELGSQLLLGETVRLLGSDRTRSWCRVENHRDGYRGWVRAWGIVTVPERRAVAWTRRARFRVAVPIAMAHAGRSGATPLVTPLFLNAHVIAGPPTGRLRPIELPDGRRGWVPAGALAEREARPCTLVERVRSLLGVPYLWGGRTPAALDCSGFTQQVLWEQGVGLPRDAHHQFAASRPLPRGAAAAPGDLVFFGRPGERVGHVGLGLGGGWYAHCRGRVRINAIESGNPLVDKELSAMVRGWRRPG
jgi:gamma-D-glutamyl-L-lysine dipeptidyl-peptidase